MLTMEQIYNIRKMYYEEGMSQRTIAALLKMDRATVAKYIKVDDFNVPLPTRQRRKGKADRYRDQVREWLRLDQEAPRKQCHTAHRVYNRLKEQAIKAKVPFDISERSIRTLVVDVKRELGQHQLVALPLLHPPGEAQVDFGETTFVERGIRYEGHHLCLTLPNSDAKYTQLFKGETFECLAQGLMDIFQHIGGVPTVIRFDNMSTAVVRIKAQGERDITDAFRHLMCHFRFDSNFCNPASGHEKGSVENYVGTSRRNLFVPIPEMDDLVTYNQTLLHRCDEHLQDKHYKQDYLVGELFETDRSHFHDLPRYPFTACRYVTARTDHYGMARFATNRYSTAGECRQTTVTLKLEAHHVTILDQHMQVIVKHPRLYGQQRESMLWGPYLAVLAKRPRAHKYSGFFNGLPQKLRQFIDGCSLPDQQQLLVFLANENHSDELAHCVRDLTQALAFQPKDVASLMAAYAFVRNKPGAVPKNPVPAHLPPTPEYTIDLNQYAKLMGGSSTCLK